MCLESLTCCDYIEQVAVDRQHWSLGTFMNHHAGHSNSLSFVSKVDEILRRVWEAFYGIKRPQTTVCNVDEYRHGHRHRHMHTVSTRHSTCIAAELYGLRFRIGNQLQNPKHCGCDALPVSLACPTCLPHLPCFAILYLNNLRRSEWMESETPRAISIRLNQANCIQLGIKLYKIPCNHLEDIKIRQLPYPSRFSQGSEVLASRLHVCANSVTPSTATSYTAKSYSYQCGVPVTTSMQFSWERTLYHLLHKWRFLSSLGTSIPTILLSDLQDGFAVNRFHDRIRFLYLWGYRTSQGPCKTPTSFFDAHLRWLHFMQEARATGNVYYCKNTGFAAPCTHDTFTANVCKKMVSGYANMTHSFGPDKPWSCVLHEYVYCLYWQFNIDHPNFLAGRQLAPEVMELRSAIRETMALV